MFKEKLILTERSYRHYNVCESYQQSKCNKLTHQFTFNGNNTFYAASFMREFSCARKKDQWKVRTREEKITKTKWIAVGPIFKSEYVKRNR